jgi:hypothetical protein
MLIRKMIKVTFLTFILATLITGCASSGTSTLMGAGLGAGLGAGIGAMVDPGPKGRNRIRNVFIGATAGSLLGAGTGYLAHEATDSAKKDGYAKGKADAEKKQSTYNGDPGQPVLVPAQVEVQYQEDQVRGNVFVPGHFEYRIVSPSHWSR